MFERYNDKARRVIFFARHEASGFGRDQIEADFLLLGIAREDPGLCVRWLGANYADLRETLAGLYTTGERIGTSVDLPLSGESRRVLAHAEEEAERMASRQITPEHLLLGLLREPGCEAAKMMTARGGDVATVRAAVSAETERYERATEQAEDLTVAAPLRNARMRLIDEEGRDIATVVMRGRIPTIGEAVSIPDGEGVETSYRIRDVIWQAKPRFNSDLQVAEVILKVIKDKL